MIDRIHTDNAETHALANKWANGLPRAARVSCTLSDFGMEVAVIDQRNYGRVGALGYKM